MSAALTQAMPMRWLWYVMLRASKKWRPFGFSKQSGTAQHRPRPSSETMGKPEGVCAFECFVQWRPVAVAALAFVSQQESEPLDLLWHVSLTKGFGCESFL
eukprot:107888-Amphidinium_carterae.1